jgi:hypothetical protein
MAIAFSDKSDEFSFEKRLKNQQLALLPQSILCLSNNEIKSFLQFDPR